MTQQCPLCEAALPEEDRFCEVCGTALPQLERPDAPACLKCQAGPDEIDHEGFCSACGFRREERGRDHFECIVSPDFAGVSDRGLRHHRNEDYLTLKVFGDSRVLILCDGVSSVHDPDVASAAAAERASLSLQECLYDGHPIGPDEMESAVAAAQNSVASLPFANGGEMEGPATTIVAAVVHGNSIVVGWRGDSRAYWIDSQGTTPLTVDHSWCNEVVMAGELSAAEAFQSQKSHAITRWLGADAPENLSPATTQFETPGPGKLLLCSDGLWNYAAHPMKSTLSCNPSAQAMPLTAAAAWSTSRARKAGTITSLSPY